VGRVLPLHEEARARLPTGPPRAPVGGAEARLRDAHLTDQVLANRADPSMILGPAGLSVRGHEFHYSTVDPVPDRVERTWRLRRSDGATRIEGY